MIVLRPVALILLVSAATLILSCGSGEPSSELPPVARVDLANLKPSDFADDELDVPYYLAHFHQVANSVVATGPTRGFIAIPVWRAAKDNQPYNARIMESILSLAWFYTTNRPWNPYHGDPALQKRLEAAMEFWCGIQSVDGKFSEYGEQKWNLAATAFATKFMGEALQLLANGPEIDQAIHKRTIGSVRKAIHAVLTDGEFWNHGIRYSNQYSNVWAGALAYLDLFPDDEISRLLKSRIEQSMTEFQSPAGYFYERDGPDWGYNLSTHHSNLQIAWHYARNGVLAPLLLEKMERWYDWFSYNATLEPDLSSFYLNREIETRQKLAWAPVGKGADRNYTSTPQAEFVVPARAYVADTEEAAAQIREARVVLESSWPQVAPLVPGEFRAFSPYAFVHRRMYQWRPSPDEKQEAVRSLPYNGRRSFVHQFRDSRKDVLFTFIRKPGYYACFNSGEKINEQQRYGIGLIRHPRLGCILQSQTGTADHCWGLAAEGAAAAYESESFPAKFFFEDQQSPFTARPGKNTPRSTLPLTIQYDLGAAGYKDLWFKDDEIQVTIEHKTPFEERLPFLIGPDTELREGNQQLEIASRSGSITLRWSPQTKPAVERTGEQIGPKELVLVRLKGSGRLTYTFSFR